MFRFATVCLIGLCLGIGATHAQHRRQLDATPFSHAPCSPLDGVPCTPSFCSVFNDGPCIPARATSDGGGDQQERSAANRSPIVSRSWSGLRYFAA